MAASPAPLPARPAFQQRRDQRAPSLFVSFGSPLAIRDQAYAQALRRFAIHLRPPRAILVVSAAWRSVRPLRVTGSAQPGIAHDYGDFPRWLRSLTYRCPGSPAVAADVVSHLTALGMPTVVDMQRPLDHVAWMPLSLMYTAANVPVVQLSLPAGASPEEVIGIGRALGPLRRNGVLIIGTGTIVCNPHRARFDQLDAPPEAWARAFDDWVQDRLVALDTEALIDYRRQGPHSHLAAAVPGSLDPLFFVLGTALQGDRFTPVFEGFHAGTLSLRTCVLAGRRKEDLRLPDELTGKG